MPLLPNETFRLNVLNAGGNDRDQHFDDRADSGAAGHARVNFHAFAACTGGSFFRDAARAAEAGAPVLLLLRGDFRASERALDKLQQAGLPVAVSLKETGLHQIARQLGDKARLRRFLALVRKADACLAPTAEATDIYRALRDDEATVAFIPTPYPLHDSQWDFTRPVEERRGIFVGTREFDVPSRNHLAALLMACRLSRETGVPVTVFNWDGRRGDRLLAEIGFPSGRLRVVTEKMPYTDYLRIVAQHQLIFEMDTSFVPGQVAGDALLCRLPCVGGNGAIGRIAHAQTCGAGRSGEELMQIATRLLRDADFYAETVAKSQRVANERLSFAAVAGELAQFFGRFTTRA